MLTTYIRDTQKHIFSVHNLGGVPLIYATVSGQQQQHISLKNTANNSHQQAKRLQHFQAHCKRARRQQHFCEEPEKINNQQQSTPHPLSTKQQKKLISII